MALTTTTYIQNAAGLGPLNANDFAQLDACREAAEAFLLQQIGRKLEKARRTEYYSGSGQRELTLYQRPVWEIHALYVDHYGAYGTADGAFDSATTLLTEGTDYVLDRDVSGESYLSLSGVVYRLRTVWAQTARNYVPGRVATEAGPTWGNIKVDYTAGYDPIPYDIQFAVAICANLLKRIVPYGQLLESERIGDYSYTILTGRQMQATYPVIGSLERLINRYREVPI